MGLTRAQVAAAIARLAQRLVVEPGVMLARSLDVSRQLVEVAIGRNGIAPEPGDKRFSDQSWSRNPMFKRLLQSYLVQREAILRLPDEVELDAKSRERARFALSLFTEAAAPTNTLLGNPSALAKAAQTRGQSLLDGLRHYVHDLRENGGMPSTVDTRPFEVGKNLAITPGTVVHRSEVFELIQYRPSGDTVYERPLVAIPPQINKYYITDIAPGRSLVQHMVDGGVPYFAMSWRNPTRTQSNWDLDTYVTACLEAIQVSCDITGSDDANVLGICAGGITMASLLGHLAAIGSPVVSSATFMVAGLDTAHESMVGLFASKLAIEAARTRSQRAGVLEGQDLARVFAWLRPNDLVWNYWVHNYLLGENPPAFDILFWNADTTRLTAGLHSDFLDLYQSNGLVSRGSLTVLDTPVDLGEVRCDVYVVAGLTDHIVPWEGAYQTTQLMGGSSEFVLSSSGHVQAIVNPPGNPKSSYFVNDGLTPPDPLEWKAAATKTPGSWWDHWLLWLTRRSGNEREAPPELGSDVHPPLDPAPGRYVHLP